MSGSAALCAAAIAAVLLASGQAAAAPPPPAGLEPQEGSSGWQAESRFGIHWKNPVTSGPPVAAVHYLVRDPLGAVVVGPRRLEGPTERVEGLRLNSGVGAYTAAVWLEDAAGAEGAPATTTLRFDDSRPGPVHARRRERLDRPRRAAALDPPQPPAGADCRPPGSAATRSRSTASPRRRPAPRQTSAADAETDLRGGARTTPSSSTSSRREPSTSTPSPSPAPASARSPSARHSCGSTGRTRGHD